MENINWRYAGYALFMIVFFLAGYSFGFVKGGQETFDFFITFINYSVDNGILKMEINKTQFENFLRIAKDYCWQNSKGSGSLSLGEIDCS